MEKTTFKIVHAKEWDEYQVQAFTDGVFNEARTYFTDDHEDALLTWKAMVKEEERNQARHVTPGDIVSINEAGDIIITKIEECEVCEASGSIEKGNIHHHIEESGETTILCTECYHEVINDLMAGDSSNR